MEKEINYKEEIQKCSEDPFYFIENYIYILNPVKGKIKFKLFDYQKRYIETILKNKFVIVNKPRQCGISTTTGAFCLWYACFKKNKEIVIISINDREAMYFLTQRVLFLYENCPKWLVGELTKQTEHKIEFDNKSFIEALPTTKRALRGRTPAISVIDEIAFNQFASEMMTGAMPSIIHGEHIILISTPNGTEGIGKYFYSTFTKAKSGENEFVPLEIDWWEVPLYNPQAPNWVDWKTNEWAIQQYKNAENEQAFRQEILREWITQDDTIIPNYILRELKPQQPIRTDFLRDVDITPVDIYNLPENGYDEKFSYMKGLWIWEEPQKNYHYTIGVDISSGRGNDYSAIEVINIEELKQVAEYKSKIPSMYFSDIIYQIATYYNNAYVGIEVNFDEGVLNDILKKGYKFIYHREKKKELIPGWETNIKTRSILIANLQSVFQNNEITIYSSRLISELATFIYKSGKPQAQKGFNDDLVFALMIAITIIPDYIITWDLNLSDKILTSKKFYEKHKEREVDTNLIVPFEVNTNLNIKEEKIDTNIFVDNKFISNSSSFLKNENDNIIETDDEIFDFRFKDFL